MNGNFIFCQFIFFLSLLHSDLTHERENKKKRNQYWKLLCLDGVNFAENRSANVLRLQNASERNTHLEFSRSYSSNIEPKTVDIIINRLGIPLKTEKLKSTRRTTIFCAFVCVWFIAVFCFCSNLSRTHKKNLNRLILLASNFLLFYVILPKFSLIEIQTVIREMIFFLCICSIFPPSIGLFARQKAFNFLCFFYSMFDHLIEFSLLFF